VRPSFRAALLLAVAATVACRRPPASGASAAAVSASPPPSSAPRRPAPAAAPVDDLVVEEPESNPTSETVTIKLVADPARKARVFWGRKDLGLAPLELQRPRGSGPLDLVVVTPGALTLHTRVFTDRDDKLALRLVAESDAPTLLGYHAPVEPSVSGAADAAKRKNGAQKPSPRQP
jgi:hypothetical protein